MRKIQKQKMESFLKTLYEAHNELKKAIEQGTENSIQAALVILADCQQGMIELGGMIEHSEGADFSTIPMLEEYCELAYQMHCHLADEKPDGISYAAKAYKNLHKLLIQIENSVRNDIKVRREVVFFPYKASMWDSLESVWMAADADKDTDAYVVPIPYYDKNPDGSFREMYYEGDEYPDYVPITNYLEYAFEERMPDMIFVHNPYDAYNYVTSVHPRFYSSNLKQFTEMLVYIPYFILGEMDADNEYTIKYISNFCRNEVARYADKIIVQSEGMRQAYIEVLTREDGGGEKARAYWVKKIDGTGSPKVDKVLNTKREDLKIPEEWMKVIQKPDGSFKKIVFYNTGVTALLGNNERMLKKIESVFQVFRENQGEITLLWRPHPLIESTLVSMRPELCEKYKKIRDKYKEEGFGIYDDTADMDRAVALSDAYYGDPSSIEWLYQKTGKPVMIQNTNAIEEQKDSALPLLAKCAVKDGDNIYFASMETSLIFSLALSTGKIKIVSHVPEETFFRNGLFGDFLRWKDRFVLIPANAKNIWIVNKHFEHWEKIELDHVNAECKFSKAVIIGGRLYALRNGYPCSICVDLESHEVTEMDGMGKDVFHSAVRVGSEIYLPSGNLNKIFKYNVETGRLAVYGTKSEGCAGILYFDGHFYLAPTEGGQLVIWNEREEKTICTNDCHALGIFEFEKKIYVPGRWVNESFYMDLDGSVKKWDITEGFFQMAKSLDDETDCLMDSRGKIYLFDHVGHDIKVFTSKIDKGEIKTAASEAKAAMGKYIYNEEHILNLEWYLTEVAARDKKECGQDSRVGSKIWALMSK